MPVILQLYACFTNPGSVSYSLQVQGTGTNGCVAAKTISLNVLVEACEAVEINE